VLAAPLLVAPGLLWAWLDQRVWPWDQAQYAEYTLKTLAVFRLGLMPGIEFLNQGLDFKAPGLTWLGVPFALLAGFFGRIEPALLCASVLWQAGTLLACWASARLVSGSRLTAAAVTALVGAAPLFIGLTHQYLVEPLQTFAIALAFLLALQAHRLSGEGLLIALCAVAALAMAAKTSSPLYCTLPLAYAAWVLVRRTGLTPMRSPRVVRVALLTLAASSLALVALWYAIHIGAAFQNVRQSTYGAVAHYYGVEAGFFGKLGYWLSSFGSALFLPHWLVLLSALAGGGLALWRRGSGERRHPSAAAASPATSWIVAAAAVHIAAAFVVYASQINDDPRFLEPLLPATALLVAWLFSSKWQRVLSAVLLSGASMQFGLAYAYALGAAPASEAAARYLPVPDRDEGPRRRLQALVELTCDTATPGEVNLVGVDYPWLSQFSANFYATVAHDGRPACRYTALPFAGTDVGIALQWLARTSPKYYIGVRPETAPSPPNALNAVAAPVFDYVSRSRDWLPEHSIADKVVVFRSRYHASLRGGSR
jgi:hypothetical protein